jgi:fatty-acyl-CoA synthase
MIVSGGENVYPAEVERVLNGHPDVAEVCVLGVDDDEWGELVSAVVVTEAGAEVTGEELSQFCLDDAGLANFKRPRQWAISDEPLPRTDTGTIVRGELLERHFDPT